MYVCMCVYVRVCVWMCVQLTQRAGKGCMQERERGKKKNKKRETLAHDSAVKLSGAWSEVEIRGC